LYLPTAMSLKLIHMVEANPSNIRTTPTHKRYQPTALMADKTLRPSLQVGTQEAGTLTP
jgi:hypothetical protein